MNLEYLSIGILTLDAVFTAFLFWEVKKINASLKQRNTIKVSDLYGSLNHLNKNSTAKSN